MRETYERIKFDTKILDDLFRGRITLAELQSTPVGADGDVARRAGAPERGLRATVAIPRAAFETRPGTCGGGATDPTRG